MSNTLKKHGILAPLPRLFTQDEVDAYALIHFQEQDVFGDDCNPALECPDGWSAEAASILAESAGCPSVPAQLRLVEENTVPSWLWRRTAESKATTQETRVQQIFDRVTGSAVYAGWKLGLFSDEISARTLFDELRYALAQRFIAIEPHALANLGINWAYGLTQQPSRTYVAAPRGIAIPNSTIDAIVSGSVDKIARAPWKDFFAATTKALPVTLRYTDIAGDWGASSIVAPIASLNLMSFRHNDGTVNIEKLQHATRLLVLLFDLQGQKDHLAIGFSNLAPLLTALALPYDSDAARILAASISAIMTAQAYKTSAEMAALRGPTRHYLHHRETTLRTLRNHCRAAYGDRNDYEKVSVLPVPLTLQQSPDLPLVAAAQRLWNEALEAVRLHGLRHTHVTSLQNSIKLAMFMESKTQGLQPNRHLTVLRSEDGENFHHEIDAPITEALARLGYSRHDSDAITRHIAGSHTLQKAPNINHVSLRALGFTKDALQRIENYLPNTNDIRLTVTPWIVGEQFCQMNLKIPSAKFSKPGFDLLQHLGFSDQAIIAANYFCFGHDTVKGAKELRAEHAMIFARVAEISPEARIRMAASVQSFISGDVDLHVSLPVGMPVEKTEKLLLGAWRQGLKAMTVSHDAPAFPEASTAKNAPRKIKTAVLHTKSPSLPARKMRLKAGSRLTSLKRGSGKSHSHGGQKRH